MKARLASVFALVVASSSIAACQITAQDDFIGPCVSPCLDGELKVASCPAAGSCYAALDSCNTNVTCQRQIACEGGLGECSGDDVRVDGCPAGADCYANNCPGANGGTFPTTCATKDSCTAKTACDTGDTEAATCPQGESCYSATGCTGSITCVDQGLEHGCPSTPPSGSQCGFPLPTQCHYDACSVYTCQSGGDCCMWVMEPTCLPEGP